jgi:hypothetical protein
LRLVEVALRLVVAAAGRPVEPLLCLLDVGDEVGALEAALAVLDAEQRLLGRGERVELSLMPSTSCDVLSSNASSIAVGDLAERVAEFAAAS